MRDLPTDVIELRATKKGEYWVKTKPVGEPMDFDRDGVAKAIGDRVMELNEFFAQQKLITVAKPMKSSVPWQRSHVRETAA